MHDCPLPSLDCAPREHQVELARKSQGHVALLAEVARLAQLSDCSAPQALGRVLSLLERTFSLARSAVGILGPTPHVLAVDCARGLDDEERARMRYALREGALGQALLGERPLALKLTDDAPFAAGAPYPRPHEADADHAGRALLCVPLRSAHRVLGLLIGELPACSAGARQRALHTLELAAALIVPLVFDRIAERRNRQSAQAQARAHAKGERALHAILSAHTSAMREVLQLCERAACSEGHVLVRGENGVGKERVARAIHGLSAERGGALITIRCTSGAEPSVEREILAQLARATASEQRPLTLFLDDIDELSMTAQAQLVRLLLDAEQQALAEPAGGLLRVLATTRSDLQPRVKKASFRADLYYRLQVLSIEVPPLRERRVDIPLLAEHFLAEYATLHAQRAVRLSDGALELLESYSWPGNVRELRNCVSRAVLLCRCGVIRQHHLPAALQPGASAPSPATLHARLQEHEREIVRAALARAGGDREQAAACLGISVRSIAYRIKQLGMKQLGMQPSDVEPEDNRGRRP